MADHGLLGHSLARSLLQGNVCLQTALVASLCKRDINAILIDRDMPRDHGNDLILERLHQLGRDPGPVVDEDELEALFGELSAGSRSGFKESVKEWHLVLLCLCPATMMQRIA
jgi:hypothetical protein